NTVLVTGPANKTAQARDIMKRIDVGVQKVITGEPTLKTYMVAPGTADAVARTMQDAYKSSSNIKISAVGGSSILVYADPETEFEIAKHLLGDRQEKVQKIIPLRNLDAAKMAETLRGIFGDAKSGAPNIEPDATQNGIFVRGTADQF